jgi:hypothetical protein
MATIRERATAHFAAKLGFETDASDVRLAQRGGDDFTLVDTHSARRGAKAAPRGPILAR